jgi:hypothetical protein
LPGACRCSDPNPVAADDGQNESWKELEGGWP